MYLYEMGSLCFIKWPFPFPFHKKEKGCACPGSQLGRFAGCFRVEKPIGDSMVFFVGKIHPTSEPKALVFFAIPLLMPEGAMIRGGDGGLEMVTFLGMVLK